MHSGYKSNRKVTKKISNLDIEATNKERGPKAPSTRATPKMKQSGGANLEGTVQKKVASVRKRKKKKFDKDKNLIGYVITTEKLDVFGNVIDSSSVLKKLDNKPDTSGDVKGLNASSSLPKIEKVDPLTTSMVKSVVDIDNV